MRTLLALPPKMGVDAGPTYIRQKTNNSEAVNRAHHCGDRRLTLHGGFVSDFWDPWAHRSLIRDTQQCPDAGSTCRLYNTRGLCGADLNNLRRVHLARALPINIRRVTPAADIGGSLEALCQ